MLQPYLHLLLQPAAFWVANCDSNNVPDLARSSGLAPITEENEITFYLPVAFAGQFMQNAKHNPHVTLSVTSVPTYESYQFKGTISAVREGTVEEGEKQREYLVGFSNLLDTIGYPGTLFFKAYFHQPAWAITLTVTDIFVQTPRKGTGGQVNK